MVRAKLVTSNTLPGRFPGSGMFMNTLSGSLTFSRPNRHRKNPFLSPRQTSVAMMSQSATSIHHSQHANPSQWPSSGSILSPGAARAGAVSMASLNPPAKPPLPPLPPPMEFEGMGGGCSESYGVHPPTVSSIITNSTSGGPGTRRQTLLSADGGGGQPSPAIITAGSFRGASTDGMGPDGYVEEADVNQVREASFLTSVR